MLADIFGKVQNSIKDNFGSDSVDSQKHGRPAFQYAPVQMDAKGPMLLPTKHFIVDTSSPARKPRGHPVQKRPIYFMNHTVAESDTLAGLSLKYGISKNMIKKHNNLHGNCLGTCSTLKIPGFTPPKEEGDDNIGACANVQVQSFDSFIQEKKCHHGSSSESEPETEPPLIEFD